MNATGEGMQGTYLEHLSWKQAEQLLAGDPVVVLPLGARCKEHGLHLPLNNDWIIAEYLARRVAEARPVVVLPTVQYGFYPAFVEYPGSVHIGRATFRDMLVDICRSIARHGPRRFYILNTGISTLRALQPLVDVLATERLAVDYMKLDDAWASVYREVVTQSAGSHADEIETSMMLYIAPDVVHMEHARPDIHPPTTPGPFTRDPNLGRGVLSVTGAYGDPTLATRAKGERIVEAIVQHVLERIDALTIDRDGARPTT